MVFDKCKKWSWVGVELGVRTLVLKQNFGPKSNISRHEASLAGDLQLGGEPRQAGRAQQEPPEHGELDPPAQKHARVFQKLEGAGDYISAFFY